MSAATVSRWSRRYLLVSAASFIGVYALAMLDGSRMSLVYVGLLGFVFHAIFGKAYALVPTYFDADLATDLAPPVQFPATVGGVVLLAVAPVAGPDWLAQLGAILWSGGVAVFVGVIGWTLRDNPAGGRTATGDHNADRQRVDRLANAVVPVALMYLISGSLSLLAIHLEGPIRWSLPATIHLFAAGAAVTMLLGIGFRLLPRLASARPIDLAVPWILISGVLGPVLLVEGFRGGLFFRVGATLEAIAIVGFAGTVLVLLARAPRPRVGLYAVALGGIAGTVGVGLGLGFAFDLVEISMAEAHLRLNVLGLLGLSIVGVAFHLYPPRIGEWPGCSDRTAAATVAALAIALAVQTSGIWASRPTVVTVGEGIGLMGAVGFAYLYTASLLRA